MHVTALSYYPIKSCGSISVQEATLDACGMMHDRRLLVTDPDGMFLTQREFPQLALAQLGIQGDRLTVSAPTMDPTSIDIIQDGASHSVQIWRNTCDAVDQGALIAEWFSTFLGAPCRLVTMARYFARRVNPAFAKSPDDQVGFADGYPCPVTTEASLDDLNSRMAASLPMNRFRPNIVVTGSEPYAEDDWRELQIGDVRFAIARPCVRCTVTTTDQATTERGEEPLRTLARYRRTGEGVIFGQNIIHLNRGTIRVGDSVTASE